MANFTPSIHFGGVNFDTVLWDNSQVSDSGSSIGGLGGCGGIYFTDSPTDMSSYLVQASIMTRVTFSAIRICVSVASYNAIIFDGGLFLDRFG